MAMNWIIHCNWISINQSICSWRLNMMFLNVFSRNISQASIIFWKSSWEAVWLCGIYTSYFYFMLLVIYVAVIHIPFKLCFKFASWLEIIIFQTLTVKTPKRILLHQRLIINLQFATVDSSFVLFCLLLSSLITVKIKITV